MQKYAVPQTQREGAKTVHQYLVFAATYIWVQLGKEKSTHACKPSINQENTLCKLALLALFCAYCLCLVEYRKHLFYKPVYKTCFGISLVNEGTEFSAESSVWSVTVWLWWENCYVWFEYGQTKFFSLVRSNVSFMTWGWGVRQITKECKTQLVL